MSGHLNTSSLHDRPKIGVGQQTDYQREDGRTIRIAAMPVQQRDQLTKWATVDSPQKILGGNGFLEFLPIAPSS